MTVGAVNSMTYSTYTISIRNCNCVTYKDADVAEIVDLLVVEHCCRKRTHGRNGTLFLSTYHVMFRIRIRVDPDSNRFFKTVEGCTDRVGTSKYLFAGGGGL